MNTRSGDHAVPGRSAAILAMIEWLSGEECHETDDAGLIAGLGQRLRAAGLPLDRLTLHMRTLHPDLAGRTLAWAPNEPVEIYDRDRLIINSTLFRESQLRQAMEGRDPLFTQGNEEQARVLRQLDVFKGRHLNAFMIQPLQSTGKPVSVLCFSTAKPGGFGLADAAAIDRILPSVRNTCELRALRQVELPILDGLLGRRTAGRLFATRLNAGEVETIEGALMLSRISDWSKIDAKDDYASLLDRLDTHETSALAAIASAGGLILDADSYRILAVFPDSESAKARALHAANLIPRGHDPLRVSTALLYGKLHYSVPRTVENYQLNFFGPDLTRLENMLAHAAQQRKPLLISGEFNSDERDNSPTNE